MRFPSESRPSTAVFFIIPLLLLAIPTVCVQIQAARPQFRPAPPQRLPPRPVLPFGNYKRAVAQARDLIEQISSPTDQPSRFTNISDLQRWGWSATSTYFASRKGEEDVVERQLDLYNALDALDIDSGSPPSVWVKAKHDMAFETETLPLDISPPSLGLYESIYNVKDGAVIVMMAYSPPHGDSPFIGKSMPELRYWSDVTSLIWEDLAKNLEANPKNLKWVFHYQVVNQKTQKIADQCLVEGIGNEGGSRIIGNDRGSRIPSRIPWPGS